jgi:hypothetical protein
VVARETTSLLLRQQILQVILQFPYVGVDFREDPDMVLPPEEVFDHQGMFVSFDIYLF